MLTRTELIKRVYAAMCEEHPGEIGKPYHGKIMLKHILDVLDRIQQDAIKEYGEVRVAGMGKLKIVRRAERNGRNPVTMELIRIPASNGIKFSINDKTKEMIND